MLRILLATRKKPSFGNFSIKPERCYVFTKHRNTENSQNSTALSTKTQQKLKEYLFLPAFVLSLVALFSLDLTR